SGTPAALKCKSLASRSTCRKISSTARSSPSGFQEVYGVSQNQHRRLQPLARTNTLGVPVKTPSPCHDRKISAIRTVVSRKNGCARIRYGSFYRGCVEKERNAG